MGISYRLSSEELGYLLERMGERNDQEPLPWKNRAFDVQEIENALKKAGILFDMGGHPCVERVIGMLVYTVGHAEYFWQAGEERFVFAGKHLAVMVQKDKRTKNGWKLTPYPSLEELSAEEQIDRGERLVKNEKTAGGSNQSGDREAL